MINLCFAYLLLTPVAFAGAFEKHLGDYEVIAQLTELEDGCPLRQAHIRRGQLLDVEGIFLEASGKNDLGDGAGCNASLRLLLSLNTPTIRCEETADAVHCQAGNNKLEVKATPVDKISLLLTVKSSGDREHFLALLLRARSPSL